MRAFVKETGEAKRRTRAAVRAGYWLWRRSRGQRQVLRAKDRKRGERPRRGTQNRPPPKRRRLGRYRFRRCRLAGGTCSRWVTATSIARLLSGGLQYV